MTRPATAPASLDAARLRLVQSPVTMRPNADRNAVRIYPGGHVWRVNKAHVERVLDVKAARMMDAPDQMRAALNAEKRNG